ncbi:MAG: hypothetical protein ACJ0GX_00025 [Parasynechococcus sp.]|uniref:hypothetical protein n=1 Tax=Parasynechococcus sp. TaxID=3101203 RepID=UPI0038878BCD
MSITESLIASVILMSIASQSSQVFGDSMQALGKSRLRDGVNTAIQRDIEKIREIVSLWKLDNTMITDGQLSYVPPQADCEDSTLATTLLVDRSEELPASDILDLSNISTPLQGLQIIRTIKTLSGNENLILLEYSTPGSSTIKTQSSTTLSIPAQGWCK